jgi:hypothetical protein
LSSGADYDVVPDSLFVALGTALPEPEQQNIENCFSPIVWAGDTFSFTWQHQAPRTLRLGEELFAFALDQVLASRKMQQDAIALIPLSIFLATALYDCSDSVSKCSLPAPNAALYDCSDSVHLRLALWKGMCPDLKKDWVRDSGCLHPLLICLSELPEQELRALALDLIKEILDFDADSAQLVKGAKRYGHCPTEMEAFCVLLRALAADDDKSARQLARQQTGIFCRIVSGAGFLLDSGNALEIYPSGSAPDIVRVVMEGRSTMCECDIPRQMAVFLARDGSRHIGNLNVRFTREYEKECELTGRTAREAFLEPCSPSSSAGASAAGSPVSASARG